MKRFLLLALGLVVPGLHAESICQTSEVPGVKLDFSSESGTATLCGFPEFGSPSAPPKKYLNWTKSGMMQLSRSATDAQCRADCVTATVQTRYRGNRWATLCGHSEFTNPSVPPKKYRVKTIDGAWTTRPNYNCAGRTTIYSGTCVYDATTCTVTNTMQVAGHGGWSYVYDKPCDDTTSQVYCGQLGLATNPTSLSPTTGVCGSSDSQSGAGTVTLSEEDTEADAISRLFASAAGVWSSWVDASWSSEWHARSAAQYDFVYTEAEFRVRASGLTPGRTYYARVTLVRRPTTSFTATPYGEVTLSGTADATGNLVTDAHATPLERGYAIRPASACVIVRQVTIDEWDVEQHYTTAPCSASAPVDHSKRTIDGVPAGSPDEASYNGLSTTTTTSTTRTVAGTGICLDGVKASGSVIEQLSNEDTEDAALARAPISTGNSPIAYRTSRGAGQYAFSFCNVTAKISAANLCPGDYDLVITYGERSQQGGDWSTRVETQKVTVTDGDFSVEKKIPFGESGTEKTILSARLFSRACGGNPGDGYGSLGSVRIRVLLGRNALGVSDGNLLLDAESISASTYTPAGLTVALAIGTEEIRDAAGHPRQIRASQTLADLLPLAPPAVGYEIRFYHTAQIGAQDPATGIYAVSGSPFVVHRIENPDAENPATVQRLRYSQIREGATKVQDFSRDPASNQWALAEGSGQRAETRTVVTNGADTATTVSVTNPAGETVAQSVLTDTTFAWGKERTREVVSADASNALTTSYTYYSSAATDGANYRRQKSKMTATGYWETYSYDGEGRLAKVVSPHLNAAPGAAESACRVVTHTYDTIPDGDGDSVAEKRRATIETLLGTEISRRYTIDWSKQEVIDDRDTVRRWDIRCTTPGATWDAVSNLVTKTCRFKDGLLADRVVSEARHDGTLTVNSYTPTANTLITTTMVGAASADGASVLDGVKTITTEGPSSHLISRVTSDIASGLELSSETVTASDEFGRPTRIDYSDGTYVTRDYACCGLESERDRTGAVISYDYDALGRQTASTRDGITRVSTYDAEGRITSVRRFGTDGTSMIQETNTYDLAGRLIEHRDALDRATTSAESFDPATGQTTRMQTNPDGGTTIETFARDGSRLSVGGTAAAPHTYEYGIEEGMLVTKDIAVGRDESDQPTFTEWTKTYTNFAGRISKIAYADGAIAENFYNAAGQLIKQVAPDGVATLYAYNARGEQEVTAIDSNANGLIDYVGTDRITKTTIAIATRTDGNVSSTIQRTTTQVWETENQDTATTVSVSEQSVDGRRAWQTTRGLTTSVVTTFDGSGGRTVTATAPDSTKTVQVYHGNRLSSLATSHASLGTLSAVTHTYDPHGRLQSSTDARNGTTTYTYYADDQVHTLTTPDPDNTRQGPGYDPQVTAYAYDAAGRVETITHPDGGIVHTSYWPTGAIKRTWGTRAYPVEYTYDPQVRLQTLTTWQDFTADSGKAVTRWNYDPQRGWLINKRYADNTGPSYTYTPVGKLHTRTWARGVTTTYTYNAAGELAEADYSDSTPDLTITYDRAGRSQNITDGAGARTFSYHASGQLENETYTAGPLGGFAIHRTFDSLSRLGSLSASSTSSVLSQTGYSYDAASRLDTVTAGANTARYGYLANSPLVETVAFKNNGVARLTSTKVHDQLNRLTSINNQPSASGLPPVAYSYTYNAANQRTRATREDEAYWSYGYDPLGQVTSGKKFLADGTAALGHDYEWTFDDIGNRETATVNAQLSNYSANLLNQYESRTVPGVIDVLGAANAAATVTVAVNGGAPQPTLRQGEWFYRQGTAANSASAQNPTLTISGVASNAGPNGEDVVTTVTQTAFVPQSPESFVHDADGNLTDDARWHYSWDGENRLVAMETTPTAATAGVARRKLEFAYDGQSRRISKKAFEWSDSAWMLDQHTLFVYDGWNLLAELDAMNSNAVIRTYVWGLDLSGSFHGAGGVGGLLAVTEGAASATHFYAYDGNGNVAALIQGTDGSAVASYDYNAFGEIVQSDGALADLNPFRFSTKYTDSETGQLYYGLRHYNPTTGRWLSRDPIQERGGMNLYGMVDNDPVNYFDTDGRRKEQSWNDYWSEWKNSHPGLSPDQYNWAEKQLARGCVGATCANLGAREQHTACYKARAQAEARKREMAKGNCCDPQIFSVHFWNDTGRDDSAPDVTFDPTTGEADMSNWNKTGRPPGPWKPRGGGYNFDYGFVNPNGTITHANHYHNPNKKYFPDKPATPESGKGASEFYTDSESEWSATGVDSDTNQSYYGYRDFNTEVWCVECKGKYGK